MKSHPLIPLVAIAAALAAAPARADDASLDPARNEVSVYGGISIVSARSSQQATVTLPAIPGFPGVPGWPATPPQSVLVNTETKLGDSALIGLRYAFYLRKQLAIEADASVAPSHDLRSSVDVCGSSGSAASSRCYGRADYATAGTAQPFDTAMDAFFGGPMGGSFRGMPGMHGGEGRYDGGYGFGGHSVTAWHYGAGLTYDILGGDVRPFVALGGGGVSYNGAPGTKTDFALRFGAGLKVYFGRLGARVDAVDYLVFNNFLTGKDEHDVHVTGGAFVRF